MVLIGKSVTKLKQIALYQHQLLLGVPIVIFRALRWNTKGHKSLLRAVGNMEWVTYFHKEVQNG